MDNALHIDLLHLKQQTYSIVCYFHIIAQCTLLISFSLLSFMPNIVRYFILVIICYVTFVLFSVFGYICCAIIPLFGIFMVDFYVQLILFVIKLIL